MHEDNSHLADALVSLVEACEPILTQGSTAERVEKVESALSDVENCRYYLPLELDSRRNGHGTSMKYLFLRITLL